MENLALNRVFKVRENTFYTSFFTVFLQNIFGNFFILSFKSNNNIYIILICIQLSIDSFNFYQLTNNILYEKFKLLN